MAGGPDRLGWLVAFAARLTGAPWISAPELALFEAANVLRRRETAGLLAAAEARDAHQQLLELPLDLWGYATVAAAAWELRQALTIYDAAFVALAQVLQVPLLTLDRRLARAHSLPCQVLAPPDGPR
jgi:predicted nucleic acid-binding protein